MLAEAALLLKGRGIRLMPLKGIWLQEFVYEDPGARPITDVDALVSEAQYDEALTTLRSAGWELRGSNVSEAALHAPSWPLPLDLHRRLFTRGAFRMPTQELFDRGTLDRDVYGVEVVLPNALDVLAHLVGHFVKSRGGRDSARVPLRDFSLLAERCRLQPIQSALHLDACGLARASRYALQLAAAHDERGFCDATIKALPKDPVGEICARAMLGLRRRIGMNSRMATLPGFVLDRSLPWAITSLAIRAWDRQQDLRLPRSKPR